MMQTNTAEYTKWMAEVWLLNDIRNKQSMMLPDGVTSYQKYCLDLVSKGRTPLPYDCLFEPGDE